MHRPCIAHADTTSAFVSQYHMEWHSFTSMQNIQHVFTAYANTSVLTKNCGPTLDLIV